MQDLFACFVQFELNTVLFLVVFDGKFINTLGIKCYRLNLEFVFNKDFGSLIFIHRICMLTISLKLYLSTSTSSWTKAGTRLDKHHSF